MPVGGHFKTQSTKKEQNKPDLMTKQVNFTAPITIYEHYISDVFSLAFSLQIHRERTYTVKSHFYLTGHRELGLRILSE